jgi:hypothetical protein
MLLGRLEIPARCLVPAGRALKRDAPLPEVQQRIVTVETTQELPNPVGNHCAETPFQVTARYDERLTGLVPRAAASATPTFQEKCHACGRMPKRLVLNGLTNW